ncbi:Zinc finger protein [Paragonimus heterotremus]|uniref:Zinc finger protein n=1 Tax=Paragonimus heterotremus TaxID=100268 RepID=A0A8J4TAV1_9TREM|nr:Zinc finger protein [Paragonimus heterotremus]
MASLPSKDSGSTHCGSANPEMLDDYCIQASSIRLPLIAAGLVNSALAMLLSGLSNRFFELALVDISSGKRQTSNLLPSTRYPVTESTPDVILEAVDKPSTDSTFDTSVQQTTVAPVSSQCEQQANIDVLNNQSNTHLSTKAPPSSPLQLLRVKEELDVEFSSLINHMTTPASLVPQNRPPQTDPTFCSSADLNVRFPAVSRMTTLAYLKRYSCDYRGCGKVFFSRSSLLYHKQSHNAEKPFICSHNGCNIAFATESLLQTHMRLHQDQCPRNQFCCNYPGCSKVFICQDRLVEHIRIHTGERPYVCDHPGCSYRFARRGNLFAHKRVHMDKTQRRQYHCVHPGCGKTFLYTRSLTEHMNIHMGERPYRCDFPNCDKSFTSKSYLHAHRRIHMGPNGNSAYNRGEPVSSYSMSPFPVTVTVPVPTGSHHPLPPFSQVSQSNEFPIYPFYHDHPT